MQLQLIGKAKENVTSTKGLLALKKLVTKSIFTNSFADRCEDEPVDLTADREAEGDKSIEENTKEGDHALP